MGLLADVDAINLGTTEVVKVSLGSVTVWESGSIPVFVGTSKGHGTAGGSFTVPLPAASAGYVAITFGGSASSGWQLEASGANAKLYSASSGSPGTSWTAAPGGGASNVIVIGYDVPVAVSGGSYSNSSTSPSINVSDAPGLVFRGFNTFGNSVTYPTNATIGRDSYITDVVTAVAHSEMTANGATGTAEWDGGIFIFESFTAFITAA